MRLSPLDSTWQLVYSCGGKRGGFHFESLERTRRSPCDSRQQLHRDSIASPRPDEIRHRVREIEKHLGLNKKIAA